MKKPGYLLFMFMIYMIISSCRKEESSLTPAESRAPTFPTLEGNWEVYAVETQYKLIKEGPYHSGGDPEVVYTVNDSVIVQQA